MRRDWFPYFSVAYAPEDVADAARAALSRQADATRVIEQILLLDMVSEMACKLALDADGPRDVDVQVTSPNGHFAAIPIIRTSQFAALGQARKLGLVDAKMLADLAAQSATATVIAQTKDMREDPKGMIVQTVPLGFEAFIEASQRKRGLLARLIGR